MVVEDGVWHCAAKVSYSLFFLFTPTLLMERNHMQQPAIPELQEKRFPARERGEYVRQASGRKTAIPNSLLPRTIGATFFLCLCLSLSVACLSPGCLSPTPLFPSFPPSPLPAISL
jgi:hypothetical protein